MMAVCYINWQIITNLDEVGMKLAPWPGPQVPPLSRRGQPRSQDLNVVITNRMVFGVGSVGVLK